MVRALFCPIWQIFPVWFHSTMFRRLCCFRLTTVLENCNSDTQSATVLIVSVLCCFLSSQSFQHYQSTHNFTSVFCSWPWAISSRWNLSCYVTIAVLPLTLLYFTAKKWDQNQMVDILRTNFLNAYPVGNKIVVGFKFRRSVKLGVELAMNRHWFR